MCPASGAACLCAKPAVSDDSALPCSAAQKSKDCPFLIKKGLKGNSGNVTWAIPEGVPDSTIYVRAYAMCMHADGTLVKCAYGNSPGFIQVRNLPLLCCWLGALGCWERPAASSGHLELHEMTLHKGGMQCDVLLLRVRRSRRSTTRPRI
jgi:hypothetical protein